MKFVEAWSEVLKQNTILKLVTIGLVVTTVVTSAAALRLAARDLPVIERGCFDRVMPALARDVTTDEIESFLKEALSSRFDTDAKANREFINDKEFVARVVEQKELAAKNISQRVILEGKIKVAGDKVVTSTDRLFSVGKVRSALLFPLEITLESSSRSVDNPYGLQIIDIKEIKSESH